MKNFLPILILLAVVSIAQAQLTNGVKISTLGTATTPLAGTEIIPLNQSGTTKSATVAQVIKAATDSATAAQNYSSGLSNLLGVLAFSNTITLAKVADAGSLAKSNSLLLANVTDAGSLAKSNSVIVANIADAGTAARSNATAFYLSGNPSGYQTASQVTTTVNSALSALGFAQSNSAVNFSSVSAPVYASRTTNLAKISLPAGFNPNYTNLDCSVATIFKSDVTSIGGSMTYTPTNLLDGEQIYLFVNVLPGSSSFTLNSGALSAPYNLLGTAVNRFVYSGDRYLLNWIVIGTNVIFSATPKL